MGGAGVAAGPLNEGFTAHDGVGFEYGAGRVNAASARRMASLREQIGSEPLTGIGGQVGLPVRQARV